LSLAYQTQLQVDGSMSISGSVQVQVISDLVAELQEYGLTRNEARVLVFLAKTGPSKASEVARAVQINRTETYRTIRNLQRRGIVEATLERPVRLQSVPFDRCLNILIDERKARLRMLEQRGEALRDQFAAVRIEPVSHEVERFQVVEGMLRIEQRLQNMCAQARKSMMTVLSPSEMVRGDTAGLFDMLTHAARGGLRVRVITAVVQPNLEIVEKLRQHLEIRHLDLKAKPIPRVSIVDDGEALFEISTSDETHRTAEEVALWINSRAFVRNLQAYFDEMWNSATPSEARIEALRRGIPPDELNIFKGRSEVSGKLNEMVHSAYKSVEIWTTMRGIQALADFHFNELKDAKGRGAKIRIIAPITSENTEGARKLVPVSELRYSEALGPTGMIIVDQSGLMLYERLPDDNSADVGADVGFWTNSNRFIETMSRAYDGMWKGVFTIYTPKRRGGQNR
jgi:sugar-specific transcriptional regulator TrmB